MTRLYNKAKWKDRRRQLRNDATKAERLLWWRLRGKQLDGLKFRRQYGVGEYVIDFYCPAARLGIEIDGESHFSPSAVPRDARRQGFIESIGICILRFTNPQVYEELDSVLEEIWRVAKARIAQLANDPPVSPLGKGGGNNPRGSPLAKGGGSAPLLDKEGVGGGRNKGRPAPIEKAPPLSAFFVKGDDPRVSPLGKGGGDPR